MDYGDDRPDSLRFNPFKAIVAPRPIGWIGTLNADGVANLAPYSFFNAVGSDPDQVMFASTGAKHSYVNARDRGEFTFSLATKTLAEAVNLSSAQVPDGVSEFELAGLERGRSAKVAPPYVAASPAVLECVTLDTIRMKDRRGNPLDRYMVIGEVVHTHIDEAFLRDGRFDPVAAGTIARLGYHDYTTVTDLWEMKTPQLAKGPASDR